jgi:hypothetical protein
VAHGLDSSRTPRWLETLSLGAARAKKEVRIFTNVTAQVAIMQCATLSDGARRPHLLRRLAIDRTGANDSEQDDRCHALRQNSRLRQPSRPARAAERCHRRLTVVSTANVICRFAGLLDGRYWARTSDPQLVDSEQRSRQFTDVRREGMVERNRSAGEHLSELERTSSVAIVATRI